MKQDYKIQERRKEELLLISAVLD
uniref:Uncharacterized protein n=1 Tax=Anguilla anguilla TaxID=7936 RepID=A0A0E9V660_ANGAN